MADIVFDEDTIRASDPDEVIAAPGAAAFDLVSSQLLVLNSDSWPGQWELDNCAATRDLDKKKPWGKSGYKTRDKGLVGAAIVAKGTLTEAEMALCNEYIAAAVPTADSGVKTPLILEHPDANRVGISAVYVESLTVKSPKNGKDFHEVELKLCQWFPEPKEVKKPTPEHPLGNKGERMNLFQSLEQHPGPFGTREAEEGSPGEVSPGVAQSFGESLGRFADRMNYIHQPDQIIPPYEEPP